MQLRVVTYNIHKGVMGFRKPSLTIHAMRGALHALKADVILLQEVQGRHDHHARRIPNWPAAAQHEFLAHSHNAAERGVTHPRYFHAYGKNAVYRHGHHGNALLSAYPIDWVENEDISDHRLEQRGVLHCRLITPQGPLHVLVAHFGLFQGSRQRQAEAVLARVQKAIPPHEPLLMGGDLNDWQRKLGVALTQGLNAQEVLPQRPWLKGMGFASFPSALPVLGLDRLFVRGFQVESARALRGGEWAKLSDHAPLVVDLRWNSISPHRP